MARGDELPPRGSRAAIRYCTYSVSARFFGAVRRSQPKLIYPPLEWRRAHVTTCRLSSKAANHGQFIPPNDEMIMYPVAATPPG